jgi:hypothetical protein
MVTPNLGPLPALHINSRIIRAIRQVNFGKAVLLLVARNAVRHPLKPLDKGIKHNRRKFSSHLGLLREKYGASKGQSQESTRECDVASAKVVATRAGSGAAKAEYQTARPENHVFNVGSHEAKAENHVFKPKHHVSIVDGGATRSENHVATVCLGVFNDELLARGPCIAVFTVDIVA